MPDERTHANTATLPGVPAARRPGPIPRASRGWTPRLSHSTCLHVLRPPAPVAGVLGGAPRKARLPALRPPVPDRRLGPAAPLSLRHGDRFPPTRIVRAGAQADSGAAAGRLAPRPPLRRGRGPRIAIDQLGRHRRRRGYVDSGSENALGSRRSFLTRIWAKDGQLWRSPPHL